MTQVAEAVWEAVTRRPWTKKSTSSDTRTTATGAAGHTDNKRNESSESYRCADFLVFRCF